MKIRVGWWPLLVVLLLVVAATWPSVRGAWASVSDPGSEQDPLVTKSYVDEQTLFRVVTMYPGQRLVADAGAEIIVRAGKATAVVSQLGGLADVTAGRDVGQGEVVDLNHLLVIPRSDGRGLVAVTEVILMVRGRYRIIR